MIAVVVIIVAIPNEGLLPIFLMSAMTYKMWWSGCSTYKTSFTSSTIQNVIRIHEFMNGIAWQLSTSQPYIQIFTR